MHPLHVVIVGHVDHGKSTLIGRLLHDTGSLPDGKVEELESICKRRGTQVMEWSFLLDSFQAERDQAITIDTTQIRFKTKLRENIIIDAPGHREFLKNMISGAAQADSAILVVDATEGMREQTRRHAYILHLLGLKQVAVVINKMDSVDYDPERFNQLSREATHYLESIGVVPMFVVPLSARHGDMVSERGSNMDWYEGKTLLQVLDSFEVGVAPIARPLRFSVQDVYRYDERRIVVGRVESGVLRKGDTILFSPHNERAIVSSIEVWPNDPHRVEARAGESIGITLDERIFVERGHVGSHDRNLPALSNVFRMSLFWFSNKPLRVGNTYKVRFLTAEYVVTVQSIDHVVNTEDLARNDRASEVGRNAVAEVTFRARDCLPIDPYTENDKTGRAVIYDGYDISGGGSINMDGYPDQRRTAQPKSENIHVVQQTITYDERTRVNGYRGGVFWLTGLSGSGKSTLSMQVSKMLHDRGFHAYVLGGDNVRHGLNADLGFSPEDRTENIRRIGEVASLMADAGVICLTAFISPYRSDRDRARATAKGRFHEIYVRADLQACENRDPKGLYKKARSGQISDFTGIDSPYEPPENPDLVIDTVGNNVDTCVSQIVDYILAWSAVSKAKGSKRHLSVIP